MDPSVIVISDSEDDTTKSEAIKMGNNTIDRTQNLQKSFPNNNNLMSLNNNVKPTIREIKPPNKYDIYKNKQCSFIPSIQLLMSDEESSRDIAPAKSNVINNCINATSNRKRSRPDIEINNNPKGNDTTKLCYTKERRLLIQKLEQELERLEMRLEIAENCELSLNDLNNSKSKYIQLHKLRERYRNTWERYCCATNFNQKSIFSKIKVTSSSDQIVNKKMELWIRKSNEFPNFLDVQQQLEKIYAELNGSIFNSNLRSFITAGSLNSEASAIFLEIGLQIVQSRKRFYKFYFESYLAHHGNRNDPADSDCVLSHKLSNNYDVFHGAMLNVEKHFNEIQNPTEENNDDHLDDSTNDTDDEISDFDTSSLSSLSESSDLIDDNHSENDSFNEAGNSSSHSSRNVSLDSDDGLSGLDTLFIDRIIQNNLVDLPSNTIIQTTDSPGLIDSDNITTINTGTISNKSKVTALTNNGISNGTSGEIITPCNSNTFVPKRVPFISVSSNIQESITSKNNPTISNCIQKPTNKCGSNTKIFKLKSLPKDEIKSYNMAKHENIEKISNSQLMTNTCENISKQAWHCNNNGNDQPQYNYRGNYDMTQNCLDYSRDKSVSTVSYLTAPNLTLPNTSQDKSRHFNDCTKQSSCRDNEITYTSESSTKPLSKMLPIDDRSMGHFNIPETLISIPITTEMITNDNFTPIQGSKPKKVVDDQLLQPHTSNNISLEHLHIGSNSSNVQNGVNTLSTSNLMATILSHKRNQYVMLTDMSTPLPNPSSTCNLIATILSQQNNNGIASSVSQINQKNITVINLESNIPRISPSKSSSKSTSSNKDTSSKPSSRSISSKPSSRSRGTSSTSVSTMLKKTSSVNNSVSRYTREDSLGNKRFQRVNKKVNGISQLFDPTNLNNLSNENYSKLNSALHLLEVVKESTANIRNKSARKSSLRNPTYNIPKVGKQRKKNKPISKTQLSKKIQF